ncbi:MAG: A/G-specific adenine glycosylase [Gammaproteobacteria bacterium]|nr:A/G-specific adenine glycosylase [Gammaproteobacteria bacterium]
MTPFAETLLAWYDRHGRKSLPWHTVKDPYRIWVSEIMLQQTQVNTVIPYFERFSARFPSVATLAAAPIDEVLHLWTGLGYYARARNLHRTAQIIVNDHDGRFPSDFDAVCRLPGIGPSTAGAILAFAYGERHTILDGNVKRVLTRVYRIDEWPGRRAVEQRLWELAAQHTPNRRIAAYTQAIMDLGATVCRRRPLCAACPLAGQCGAHRDGNPATYPVPAPRKTKPTRSVTMVMIHNRDAAVMLERRPPAGIWGGLWGFPEVDADSDVADAVARRFGVKIRPEPAWEPVRHSFTHYHLTITPQPAVLIDANAQVMESREIVWYNPGSPDSRGLAAPVKRLLQALRNEL